MNQDSTSSPSCDEEIHVYDVRLAASPFGWKAEDDIAFGHDPLQAFDGLYPTSSPTRLPAVLMVHGGGWMGGDKAATHYRLLLRQFADAGFACFSTDYRLAPDHRFPAQAEDIASAAQYLAKNSTRFGIDPARIAVMGSSAGGHLAALVALAGARFGAPEIGGHPGPFAAAACLATPTDFRTNLDDPLSQTHDDPAAVALFGRPPSEIPELAADASPVAHAGPTAPPFLLLHNRSDPRVDSRFSTRLHMSLLDSGTHSELEIFEGDSHGLRPIHDEVFSRVSTFFRQHLGT